METDQNQPISQNFNRKIGKKMSLIDLNRDLINFKCDFRVKADHPFQAVVVTQEQLDNPEFQIEYQNVQNGILDGSFENINNIYYNYCLLLKSDKEITTDISLSILPLPKTEIPSEPNEPHYESTNQPQHEHFVHEHLDIPFYKTPTFTWIIIFIGIGLIIYLLFSDDKKTENQPIKSPLMKYTKSPNVNIVPSPNVANVVPSPNVVSSPNIANVVSSPNVSTLVKSPPKKSPVSLLSKLKNMEI